MSQINVTRSSMPYYEEYCEEIKDLWESRWLTNMGVKHNRLKGELCEYLKVPNTELFCNGHIALYCAIKALRLTGEIITTPFTFASTTNAIVQAGCTPVFCDVADDYTIDTTKIEELITERTSAILAVHVYGNICDVEAIEKIAKKHSLRVIYDAAHAFGVEYRGRGICTYGDISMLSFHATKVFHTIEGGALCYNDASLTPEIVKQRGFGLNGEEIDCFGTNGKMNEFCAAMGLCNLRHIDDEIKSRGEAYELYEKLLSGVNGLTLLPLRDGIKQNFAYYPVLFDKAVFGKSRDEVAALLAENGVVARKYFYPLVSSNKEFSEDLSYLTPRAEEFSKNVLCLPMYAHLGAADIERICKIILE
ncbi:MAG: DegT/DnrJ/EryC1/StrS family aminotransferase [Ruminococcaceae bacterium]|nr:DegT/DnrJ/EryC1/StrS family aminotransferase [Oscillospiraceae bacterium]